MLTRISFLFFLQKTFFIWQRFFDRRETLLFAIALLCDFAMFFNSNSGLPH